MKKRCVSWLLAVCMLVSLAPQALPVWASAAGESRETATQSQTESKLSANTYSALGLNRTIDENKKPSGQPYGNEDVGSTIATNVINELYVNFNGSIHYGWSILDDIPMEYKSNIADDKWNDSGNFYGAMGYWRPGQQPNGFKEPGDSSYGALFAKNGEALTAHNETINGNKSSSISSANKHLVYQYSKSEAFSPNTGKDNYVAELVMDDENNVYLYIYQAEGGNKRYVRGVSLGKNKFAGNKNTVIWNWEYDAMLDIAAGDMDGDGYDEIAVYSANKVSVYSYENNQLKEIATHNVLTPASNVNTDQDQYKKFGSAIVTLAFGDLDADDKDELVIAENMPYWSKNIEHGTVGIYALGENELESKYNLSLQYNNDSYAIRYVNVATGDIDGDNKDELIAAGYYSGWNNDAKCLRNNIWYNVVKVEDGKYKNSGWKSTEFKTQDLLGRVVDNTEQLIPPVSLTCAATQGVGYAEQVFLGGCLYTVNNDNSLEYLTRISTNREYKKDNGKKANKEEIFVLNVVAGNFNGNEYGQEQIVYAFGMKHDDSDRYWYDIGYLNKKEYGNTNATSSSGYWYGQEQVMNFESSYNRDSNKKRASLYLSLAAVDCDNDSTLMRYTGQEITWTKPEVLTVLQSAPYFQDLQDTRDYLNQSQTAYGTGHGTSTTATAGASLSLGTYVSFEQDFSVFGVKIASIEAEAQTKHSFEYGFEGTKEKEINITYSGSAGDDYAIVYAVPYIEYQYETWIPGYKIPEQNNGYDSWKTEYVGNYLKGKIKNWSTLSVDDQKKEIENAVKELNLTPGREVQGSWQPSTVSVPMDPAKVLISVDAYDAIAAQTEGLEPIRGNILKSTPGDPSTYDSFDARSEFHQIGGNQTVSTGEGGNVSIEENATASQTHTFSYSYEFEAKAGVGAGGLTVGVLAGFGTNAGGGTGKSSSKSCSATVDNLPSDAKGYAFSWRFGTRKAELNGNDVLVLEYQIDKSSLQQPPSPPRNLRVESVTADSVTLEWDAVPGAGSYDIYQTTLTETEESVCIATVPGTATSYTDQRVLPNNSYIYYIKNVTTTKGESIFSTGIKVSTLLQNDGRFVIEEQPGSNHKFQTYVGGTATATVKAKYVGTDGEEKSLLYIWKKYNPTIKRWEDYMRGSETLSVPNVTKAMEGDKFRCQVFYSSGLYMYTEPIALEVGKAETTTAMTGPETNSTANASYAEIVKKPVKDDKGNPVYEQVAVTKKIGDNIYTEYITETKDKTVYLGSNGYYSISGETASKLDTQETPIKLHYDDANGKAVVINLIETGMTKDTAYPGTATKVSYIKTDDITGQKVSYEADQKHTIATTTESILEVYCKSETEDEDAFWFVKIGTDENGQNKYAPATLEKETTITLDGMSIKVSDLTLSTKQGAPMYTSEQVFHSGDTVTLSAKVTEDAGFAAAKITGSVTFKIVNSVGDGSGTVTGTIDKNGVATATWKPSVAGVYTITAAYEGSEQHMGSVSAGSITINVVVPGEKKLVIDSPNSMTYGDPAIDLKATLLSGAKDSGTGLAQELTSGVTYSVNDAAIQGKIFNPTAAGTYTIKATYTNAGETLTATKTINVGKRTVKIVPKVVDGTPTYDLENVVSADKNLFANKIQVACAGAVSGAAAGQYPINVTYTPGDKETEINSKYLVLVDTTQVYTVSDDVVKVTNATNSNNGTVTLQYIVEGVSYTVGSDGVVPKGAKLTATANPKKGYKVKQWWVDSEPVYVNGTGAELNTEKTITVSQALQNNCTIKAEFELAYYTLQFEVKNDSGTKTGTISANYLRGNTVGGSFVSGKKLNTLESVQLTAEIDDNQSIKEWRITQNNKTETILEGSEVYTGTSYIFDASKNPINADTKVTVLTEDQTSCTVSIALVNNNNEALSSEGATISFGTEGDKNVTVKNGVYTYAGHKHDNIDVTITLPDGLIVDEWIRKNGTSNEVLKLGTFSSDKKTWSISNLSESLDLTVRCNTPNSFQVTTTTQLNGTSSDVGGTIKVCKVGQNEPTGIVTSGSSVLQATGLRVTVTPNEGYQLMDVALYDGDTKIKELGQNSDFTIDSVNSNINIVANFVKKPVIKITTPTEAHGTVTANGMELSESTVPYGSTKDIVFTATPDVGYEVGTWAITGVTAPEGTPVPDSDNQTYTYTPDSTTGITSDVTVTVTFKKLDEHTITFSVVDTNGEQEEGGKNGTLTATAERKGMANYAEEYKSFTDGSDVYAGSTVTFTAKPDEGYRVKEWQVDGAPYPDARTNTSLTLTPTKDTTVTVQFMEIGSKVTARAQDNNGSITSAKVENNNVDYTGGFTLMEKAQVVITAEPNLGFVVDQWSINGTPVQTGGNSFTYTAQTADTGADITVSFRQIDYLVSWSTDHGTVTAAGAAVNYTGNSANIRGGTTVTFTVTGYDGYTLTGWTVNGEQKQSNSNSTFTWEVENGAAMSPAIEAFVVKPIFSRGSYTVTLTHPANGTGTVTANASDLNNVTGGTQVTFIAEPAEGYILVGWTVNGTTTNTRDLRHTITVNSGTTVTAIIVPSHYNVTYSATGSGSVSAEGFASSPASVPYGESITFTAVPNGYHHVESWKVNGIPQPNTANKKTFTLDNVTANTQVEAIFSGAVQYEVGYKVEGTGGNLSAKAGDEPLTLDSNTKANVLGGTKLTFTAAPGSDQMVQEWKVNNEVVEGNLSNTLEIASLNEKTDVTVSFEPKKMWSIPADGDGYKVTEGTKIPNQPNENGKIRDRGTATFTIAVTGDYSNITNLVINGYDCIADKLAEGSTALSNCTSVSVQKKNSGSYTITVTGVKGNITSDITAQKVFVGELTSVPVEFQNNPDLNSLDKIKARLERQLTGSSSSHAFYDITLKYWAGEEQGWQHVIETNFPKNGVDVTIPYPIGTNSKDTFTLVHLLTSGDVEKPPFKKGENGLEFHVTSLSPFGVSWVKYVAPTPGGGISGGGVVSTCTLTFETNGGSVIDKVTKDSGTTVDLAAYVPTRAGYTFAGWYSDKALTKAVTSVKLTADTTVYAKWNQGGAVQNPFVDVKEDAYYYDAVLWAVEQKITSGTSATTFSPEASCTRAQMVTFLWRAAGSPKAEDGKNPFADVKADAYYYDAVLWAVEQGVTSGTSATTFSPDATVTRGQTVTFLYRNAGSPDVSGTMPFTDVEADAYYAKAVQWAVEQKITTGTSETTFSPMNDCTRGQIVTFLYRAK